jgi:hypothetical protein
MGCRRGSDMIDEKYVYSFGGETSWKVVPRKTDNKMGG